MLAGADSCIARRGATGDAAIVRREAVACVPEAAERGPIGGRLAVCRRRRPSAGDALRTRFGSSSQVRHSPSRSGQPYLGSDYERERWARAPDRSTSCSWYSRRGPEDVGTDPMSTPLCTYRSNLRQRPRLTLIAARAHGELLAYDARRFRLATARSPVLTCGLARRIAAPTIRHECSGQERQARSRRPYHVAEIPSVTAGQSRIPGGGGSRCFDHGDDIDFEPLPTADARARCMPRSHTVSDRRCSSCSGACALRAA